MEEVCPAVNGSIDVKYKHEEGVTEEMDDEEEEEMNPTMHRGLLSMPKMEKTSVEIKKEDCEWQSAHLQQESCSIKEEEFERVVFDIKEDSELTSHTTDSYTTESVNGIKEEDLKPEFDSQPLCPDEDAPGLGLRPTSLCSSPHHSVLVKSEYVESDMKRTEEASGSSHSGEGLQNNGSFSFFSLTQNSLQCRSQQTPMNLEKSTTGPMILILAPVQDRGQKPERTDTVKTQLQRQITIQEGNSLPQLNRCTTCCSNFHCPFCSSSFFKPSRMDKLIMHLRGHFNRAVVHNGFTIHRCGFDCRPSLHYHCLYCQTTILRRFNFEHHVLVCRHTQQSVLPRKILMSGATVTSPPAMKTSPTTTATVTSPSATTVKAISVRVRAVIRRRCPICNVLMNKCNLKKHIDRKHTKHKIQDINVRWHLMSQCLDESNGIFAVLAAFEGHSIPLHVQCKTRGGNHSVSCELNECRFNMDVAQKSGIKSYRCQHIRSVSYCASIAKVVSLSEDVLTEMVKAKWLSGEQMKNCLAQQLLANTNKVPLSVHTTIAIPQTKKCISVYEPAVSYENRMGRVMVVFDTKLNTWHCPCAKVGQSCIHINVAQWHLFETHQELFWTACNAEEVLTLNTNEERHNYTEGNGVKDDNSACPSKGV